MIIFTIIWMLILYGVSVAYSLSIATLWIRIDKKTCWYLSYKEACSEYMFFCYMPFVNVVIVTLLFMIIGSFKGINMLLTKLFLKLDK